jgi:hypothetical protein
LSGARACCNPKGQQNAACRARTDRAPTHPTRPAQVVAGADLSGCGAAVVLDRADNEAAAARQTRLDNRKPAALRALESPTAAAALLLMRGARGAALGTTATTAWANAQLAGGLLRGLAEGRPLAAAAMGALVSGLQHYELHAVREAGLAVWGVPPESGGEGLPGEAGKRQLPGRA